MEPLEVVGTCVGILAVLGGGVAAYTHLITKVSRVEFRVDQMWESWARSARAAATHQGLGEFNSPFSLTDKGRAMIPDDLKRDLQTFYKTFNKTPSDKDFWAAVEKEFAPQSLIDSIRIGIRG